ncbi:MAG: hypothetical protein AABZ55_10315 [Bdellovibrionota bacterium]
MKHDSNGQALLELVLGLLPLVAAITAGSFVFHAEWNRLKCSRLVFDAAHDALTGKALISTRYEILKTGETVSATWQCGDAHEQVILYSVESGRW